MSWYECPRCGRKLADKEVYESKCRRCGEIVVQLRGVKTTVNLNAASKQELQRVVGLGSTMAEKIIQHRPFNDVAELRRVPGIGETRYSNIKYKVYVK